MKAMNDFGEAINAMVADITRTTRCPHENAILKTVNTKWAAARRYYVCRDCGAEFVYSIDMFQPAPPITWQEQ